MRHTYDTPRSIRWIYLRDEWYRQLHPGRWRRSRRDIVELGGRAASCLWAEEESTLHSIRERFRGKR